MARKTFFSFHYERDNWRAAQIRNASLTQKEDAGFIDAVDWEEVKKKGQAAIEKWIQDQLHNTTCTVVLIGAETSTRPYVAYEVEQSRIRGNGLIGIYIHNVKDAQGKTDTKGANPLPSGAPTYDWVNDDGRANLGTWIEKAARAAGK